MCDDYVGVFLEWADVALVFGGVLIGAFVAALVIAFRG